MRRGANENGEDAITEWLLCASGGDRIVGRGLSTALLFSRAVFVAGTRFGRCWLREGWRRSKLSHAQIADLRQHCSPFALDILDAAAEALGGFARQRLGCMHIR